MTDPIAFLQTLIRAQHDGEAAVQRLVASEARSLGCSGGDGALSARRRADGRRVRGARAIDAGERESVVARFRGNRRGPPRLIFFAHPDGEPVVGTERWKRDPFAGTVEGGRIHGWGAADDLSGVAIMIEGLRAALARPAVRQRATSSSPARPASAMRGACPHCSTAGCAPTPRSISTPPTSGIGMREIKAFCLGQLDFHITVAGTPPPGPTRSAISPSPIRRPIPRGSPDGHPPTGWMRLRLAAWRRRSNIPPCPPIERSANLLISHLDVGRAGRAHTRIAAQGIMEGCAVVSAARDGGRVRKDRGRGDATAPRRRLAVRHPPSLAWMSGVTAAETPVGRPLYRASPRPSSPVTGEPPHVNPMHTASDIRNPIVQTNIPTVGLGPLCGNLTQNGRSDEWVDVEDYRRAVKVAASII